MTTAQSSIGLLSSALKFIAMLLVIFIAAFIIWSAQSIQEIGVSVKSRCFGGRYATQFWPVANSQIIMIKRLLFGVAADSICYIEG